MAGKIYFVLIISILIGVNLFFSCTPVDDGDHTPPTIEVFSPVANTLIHVTAQNDTLFPIFKARFTDDVGLSSYTFRIRHEKDSISTAPGGTTAYFYKNYQGVSIFDSTQVTIVQTFRIDSVITVTTKATSTSTSTSKTYPIWEGVYQLDVSVVDKQRNVTKLAPIPILIKKKK